MGPGLLLLFIVGDILSDTNARARTSPHEVALTQLCEAEIRIGWVHPDDMGELRPRRIPAQVLDALPAPAWTTS